jgi:hypothetical protein
MDCSNDTTDEALADPHTVISQCALDRLDLARIHTVVRAPGGNDVGLMSPIDQHRRFTPKT